MYKKAGTGYILCITDATHRVKTDKGIQLVSFDPLQYALNNATCHQIPVDMGMIPIDQIDPGSPGYGPALISPESELEPSSDIYAIGGVYQYKFVSDIEPEVEIGDRVYFKPRTLNNRANFIVALKNGKGQPDKYIYKCPYENIFCAVRDKKIIMIGSWVLVEPIVEDWDDILIKTYYDIKDSDGNKIERPKKEWIQKKVMPEVDKLRGYVRHIGKPLKGDDCDVEVNDLVVFRRQAGTHYQKIGGVNYLVIKQNQILAKLLQNVKVA